MTCRPSQTRHKYLNLVVHLDAPNAPVTVAVKRYACSQQGYGGGQNERRLYRERLYRAAHNDRLHLSAQHFVDVFTGKGTPDNIAKCLRLAARHRIYSHDGTAAGPGSGLDAATGIRRVADAYIGLDCNGFVGNWAIMAGIRGASVDRLPFDWLGHVRLRQNLADIAPYDLVIWHSGTHIAVIESCAQIASGANRRNVEVGESSSGGIQIHPYVIRLASTPAVLSRHGNSSTPFVADSAIHGNGVRVFIGAP